MYSFKYCKFQKELKAFSLASKKLSTEICSVLIPWSKNFITLEQNFIDGEYEEPFKMKCQYKVS